MKNRKYNISLFFFFFFFWPAKEHPESLSVSGVIIFSNFFSSRHTQNCIVEIKLIEPLFIFFCFLLRTIIDQRTTGCHGSAG